jgi:hypothetical protein
MPVHAAAQSWLRWDRSRRHPWPGALGIAPAWAIT